MANYDAEELLSLRSLRTVEYLEKEHKAAMAVAHTLWHRLQAGTLKGNWSVPDAQAARQAWIDAEAIVDIAHNELFRRRKEVYSIISTTYANAP